MDDEIDLRHYIQGVVRRWPIILALTVVAAVIGAVIALSQPSMYAAVALVSVSGPRYAVQPDATNANLSVPTRAYPDLALSGDVLTEVFTQTQSLFAGRSGGPKDVAALQNRLMAMPAADPTLIRLEVRDANPQIAAQIANIWAGVFAAQAGALYSQDQANLKVYADQLAAAQTALGTARNNLAAFQSNNQASILSAQLDSQQAALTDDLNRQHDLELLTQDTHDLITRLSALPATTSASPADDLALLAISARIYSASSSDNSSATPPVQIQLPPGQTLAGPTVADQLVLAGNLRDTIAARLSAASGAAAALQPQILALQGKLAQANVQESQLQQAVSVASDRYETLANQLEGATLVAQVSANAVQVASRAAVPSLPTGPRRLVLVAGAAGLGLVLGLIVTLALEYWQSLPALQSRQVHEEQLAR